MMKKCILYTIILLDILAAPGCKKFLDIQPIDKLSGNNFYQSKEDVVANIYDLSRKLFNKFNETQFIGATGEYRSGEVLSEPQADGGPARAYVDVLGRNDLITLLSGGRPWDDYYHFWVVTDWTEYYQVIQGANILISKLNKGIPGLTATETQQFEAEAVFARSLAYFIMVRLYGDVPYFTDAFHSTALPRENMVTVMKKTIADLLLHKDHLPWSYSDPALKGVRASRGSIIALLMNMNMWNAGFDKGNAEKYYEETATLGNELIASNAYRLLPLIEWSNVVKGRSDESLFEFYRSVNYGDNNSLV